MALRTSDVVPVSDARARLTELAEEVVNEGHEKVLTKNGSSYVALIDASKLDHYRVLEEEFGRLVLGLAALEALDDVDAGRVYEEDEIDAALAMPWQRAKA